MKKMKRIIATIIFSTMLMGSVITVNAACVSHTGNEYRYMTTNTVIGSHKHGNGNICTMTKVTDYYKVVCTKCTATLSTRTEEYILHSAP